MCKCERCTIIESAFGLRDPLPPRVASLDVEISTLHAKDDHDQALLEAKGDTDLFPRVTDDSNRYDKIVQDAALEQPHMRNPIRASSCDIVPSSRPIPFPSNVSKHAAGGSSGVSPHSPQCPSNPHPKKAAFSFKAMQPSSATAALREPGPPSVLALIIEHVDILDVLMRNCPDFGTLLALVTSCKTAKLSFESHPQGIIKAMLETMPQELQYLTVALIGINGCNIETSYSIRKNMEIWLGMGPKPLRERLQKEPIEIVRKLARSFSAIDLFMKVIPKNCVNNFADYKSVLASRVGLDYVDLTSSSNGHPLLQQTEWSDIPDDTEWDVPYLPPGVGPQAISLPLNDREMYRLKRALLRYELFCAIFYLGPDKYYDKQGRPQRFQPVPDFCRRHAFCKAQEVFLQKYVNPWEIGELAVVSHFMYDLVRNAYFYKYKTLRFRDAYDSWYGSFGNKNHGRNRHFDHEEVADEFDNHTVWFASQGLRLLHRIYVDRNLGYQAIVEKHCEPRYRAAELFVPFERCADRQWLEFSDPKDSWEPRHTWPDTLGMELPSKSWLAKGPTSDSDGYDDVYWGEKWMRKIGYYIWDRD